MLKFNNNGGMEIQEDCPVDKSGGKSARLASVILTIDRIRYYFRKVQGGGKIRPG